mmetsp:Transcript_20712/g.26941  ORF Transcript_20712/g.26941 Transcript_20712/m.26941 type:complete len:108 (+) Transcript_20712:1857-2180(+)
MNCQEGYENTLRSHQSHHPSQQQQHQHDQSNAIFAPGTLMGDSTRHHTRNRDSSSDQVEPPQQFETRMTHKGKGRAGDMKNETGFKTLDIKPGQRMRIRPQPRRTRN